MTVAALSSQSSIRDIALFGSFARGDADPASDVDVIVVVDSPAARDALEITSVLGSRLARSPQIALYGTRRIAQMYRQGHLFAWHLFLEARPFPGLASEGFLRTLGEPAPYLDAAADVRGLLELLVSIPANLTKCPRNVCYEAGLLYMCARCIAMSASWYADSGLDFSRDSPYRLQGVPCSFPLPRPHYASLVHARLAGTRGHVPPSIAVRQLLEIQKEVEKWAREVLEWILNNSEMSVPRPVAFGSE